MKYNQFFRTTTSLANYLIAIRNYVDKFKISKLINQPQLVYTMYNKQCTNPAER